MQTKAPANANPPNDADAGFAGTLKNIQLVDLIQMCCLSASSLCMQVAKGGHVGTIYIVDGEIVHAACEAVVGEEAFYRILGWQTGSFESIEMPMVPQRSIDKNYQFLVMEAARRVDEQGQSASDPSAKMSCPPDDAADDRLRVLIVDDSSMMRKILASMLSTSNQINVVGTASNGQEAIALIDSLSPDLVALDVNMPVMDGTSTIKHIMIKKPCPVVIMSNPGDGSAKTILNFLELGAVDFISKPTKSQDILIQQQKIMERITMAATAKVGNFRIARFSTAPAAHPVHQPTDRACRRLVVVISGPGGHLEQMSLLSGLSPALSDVDGAVVALQSLPPSFGPGFARYLYERCGCPASAVDRDIPIVAGQCYVSIHGCPLTVHTIDHHPFLSPGSSENRVPYVDRFLSTAARIFMDRLAVVLLSGANTGGQSGVRAVRESGGQVIVHKRVHSMVAEPLDQVVEAGLMDDEVGPADLVKTVLDRLDRKY